MKTSRNEDYAAIQFHFANQYYEGNLHKLS